MIPISDQLREIEALLCGKQRHLDSLSPAIAACLAAVKRRGMQPTLDLSDDAFSHAVTVGLDAFLHDREPSREFSPGQTYSPLVELASHDQVDASNAVINELISRQLSEYPALASQACQLVGELHNNVPAHARGVGFSIAEYSPGDGLLELAVVDCGQGMLRNVQWHYPEIATYAQAIEWCMQEGHTTAAQADDWAQWMPGDAMQNPYGDAVPSREELNHHLGLGLWKLERIAEAAGGAFVVWSGDARLRVDHGKRAFDTALSWAGVVVILRLPIAGNVALERQLRLGEMEALARRLEI